MLTDTKPFREKGSKLPRYCRKLLENALKGYWIALAVAKKDRKAAEKCLMDIR
jgi:hypothetical protein